jgi:amino acid transporter
MSFLFIWQTCLQAPLVVASGAIGFSQYFSYLVPLTDIERRAVSGIVVVLVILLLYRNIKTIGKISLFLWSGVIITIGWIIISGLTWHHQVDYSFLPGGKNDTLFSWAFASVLGEASVSTVYSYLGYYNVCHLGGEIKNPQKNIPRSIFISVFCIAFLYLLMNYSIVHVLPRQEAMKSKFVVSTFMEKIYGTRAASIATMLVLWIAFASLFAVVLGYSRVPYAAAADGHFFPVFAKLHPTRNFPYVSLLFLGGIGFVFSLLFKLENAIKAILAMRILVQFIAQSVGVVLLRRRLGKAASPYKMWLYPLPVILSILIWLFVLFSTGKYALLGLALAGVGAFVYWLLPRLKKQ